MQDNNINLYNDDNINLQDNNINLEDNNINLYDNVNLYDMKGLGRWRVLSARQQMTPPSSLVSVLDLFHPTVQEIGSTSKIHEALSSPSSLLAISLYSQKVQQSSILLFPTASISVTSVPLIRLRQSTGPGAFTTTQTKWKWKVSAKMVLVEQNIYSCIWQNIFLEHKTYFYGLRFLNSHQKPVNSTTELHQLNQLISEQLTVTGLNVTRSTDSFGEHSAIMALSHIMV